MDGATDPVNALSPSQKREQLAQLLRQRSQQQLRQFPLSFTQQRLWLLNEMEGGDTIAYNIPIGLRLLGPLDPARLERALGDILRRHDALRTTFQLRDGAPVQVVHRHLDLGIPETDLGGPEFTDDDRRRVLGFVQKPWRSKELLEAIRKALDSEERGASETRGTSEARGTEDRGQRTE